MLSLRCPRSVCPTRCTSSASSLSTSTFMRRAMRGSSSKTRWWVPSRTLRASSDMWRSTCRWPVSKLMRAVAAPFSGEVVSIDVYTYNSMCVHVYIYIIHLFSHMSITYTCFQKRNLQRMKNVHTHMYICMCIRICTCMCICIYIYICVCACM